MWKRVTHETTYYCTTQKQKHSATDTLQSTPPAEKRECLSPGEHKTPICEAIVSVGIKNSKQRLMICFLCLGNPRLPEHERLKNYKTPGSLSHHFVDCHIKPYPTNMRVKCAVCNKELKQKAALGIFRCNNTKRLTLPRDAISRSGKEKLESCPNRATGQDQPSYCHADLACVEEE